MLGPLAEVDGRAQQFAAQILFQLLDRTHHKRQGLVPRTQLRLRLHERGLRVHCIGQQNVIHALLQQRVHMPVRHLDRETGLRNREFFTAGRDAPVSGWRNHHVVSQFLQVGTPEGETIVEEHGAGNTDRLPSVSWWLECRL